ncbi:MFS transporter [Anaerolinea thermophila]|uniref:Major facilitator superfamily transporter n=1 Tax=Anaerolinea thermophila (strain DSM 14523 / JCM 11388 / NBRC 100420 / UNI-1) TaxID=926569 RepID=E8N3C2_ANATU|nr:MFS transporter [Anaerolinea thermophila]BAJ62936.1 major facilitator superfamily transporter [Anaerolinea thermophila UNI-1]
MSLLTRFKQAPQNLKIFATVSLLAGMAYSIYDSTFNNFLESRFSLTGFQRSFLEFPRELPGFLVVFVSALLWFLCSRRLSAFSFLLSAIGALLLGYFTTSYAVMSIWLFIYSMGMHLFLPLSPTIGMELAHEGQTGRRLGQLNAIRNFAAILGSFLVALGFRFLNFNFKITFTIVAVALFLATLLMLLMDRGRPQPSGVFLKLHKEYRLYYALVVLYGSRKQIFVTFAPWVLVSIFQQPTQLMGTLFTIGGIIGIIFQPFLGWLIDHYGERFVLTAEAVLLAFVCIGYGFSRSFLPENLALLLTIICFLLDQMLMSVSMARATYMRKIAKSPEHVQTTLTAGVTIDHVFSISVALLGGVIWNAFGYQYVFLFGALIAVLNFIVARQIRLPGRETVPVSAD